MHLGWRATLLTLTSIANAMLECASSPKVIDSAIHLWSNGSEPFPWAVAPPASLQQAATAEAYLARAREAGVAGALVVQPANHMYDHSYVAKALKDHPQFFRGMGLANPSLPPADAVAQLESLRAAGFVGVRFNAGKFEGGLTSEVAKALYGRAGELGMPVGVMAFGGIGSFLPALHALCEEFPSTTLVVDHLGFFRQPAIGGQLGDAASNDELAWQGLLGLAKHPNVYVKVSAMFRASAEPPLFADLKPRVTELLRTYGASRLMWGSDFPFSLEGGFPLPEGVTSTPAAMSYPQSAQLLADWSLPELAGPALDELLRGTAARVWGFETTEPCSA